MNRFAYGYFCSYKLLFYNEAFNISVIEKLSWLKKNSSSCCILHNLKKSENRIKNNDILNENEQIESIATIF